MKILNQVDIAYHLLHDIFTESQRFPNNLRTTLVNTKTYYEMPKIWNQLNEEEKQENISYKNLINKLKTDILNTYNEFQCNKDYCYSCKS